MYFILINCLVLRGGEVCLKFVGWFLRLFIVNIKLEDRYFDSL